MTYSDRYEGNRGYFHTTDEEAVRDFFASLPCPHDHDEDDCTCQPTLPLKNALCGSCNGEGKRAMHGMSFTMSEFYETFDDPESREDYFRGKYDTRCEDCKGEKVIKEIDYDAIPPDLRKELAKHLKEVHYANAESLAERRMGC